MRKNFSWSLLKNYWMVIVPTLIFCIFLLVSTVDILTSPSTPEEFATERIPAIAEITTTEEIPYMPYKDFWSEVEDNQISIVYYEEKADLLYFNRNDIIYQSENPQYAEFRKDLLQKRVKVSSFTELQTYFDTKNTSEEETTGTFIQDFIKICGLNILCVLFITVLFHLIEISRRRKLQKNPLILLQISGPDMPPEKTQNMTENNNSNRQPINRNPQTKTFDDVAGHKEVKKDLRNLVDMMKNRAAYEKAGAKLPKGVILYGPPGTGKTLLAKAIAGEADVPFLFASGSDFVEQYVGVGAKRIREMFQKAKKNAPCILFIDEIDAIGGRRHDGENGEYRQTLNALLVELDGFTPSEGILVIAATNRLEDLDEALLRPGRFTNKYCVPLPATPEERLEILTLYAQNKKFTEDFDFMNTAKSMIGCSPAEIESVLNEAAIIQVQERKEKIDATIFDKAFMKSILNGHVKENQTGREKEELELVAYHEAGHALIGKLLGMDVTKVTILSTTSGAGGVTFTTPHKQGLHSIEDLKKEVLQLYGGRMGEKIFYKEEDKVTTGASNDIEKATAIIHHMICSYGMTKEYGLLNLEKLAIKGSDILQEEIKLSNTLAQESYELLKEHEATLIRLANKLLERETLYTNDIDEILKESMMAA